MVLHYVLHYEPATWEALHGLVLPLGPVLLLSLYFLHWSATSATGSNARSGAEEEGRSKGSVHAT